MLSVYGGKTSDASNHLCRFFQIDSSSGGPIRHGVTFDTIRGWATRLVALVHPSFRISNVRHRRFNGIQGHEAELAMLAAVQEAAK